MKKSIIKEEMSLPTKGAVKKANPKLTFAKTKMKMTSDGMMPSRKGK